MDTLLTLVIAAPIGAAYLAALVYAIVQVIRTPQLSDAAKLVWGVAIVLQPFLAALVWYFAGPRPFGIRLVRDLR
ncbi:MULTISPECIES: PLDc N-terminal domain-containing protein [unclassified Salinibacterium]|uniref:PLDc N-terminal domain-containing protein n=1 Tax=unclassified Salinibacterium TaxID=2632331 RepID=UPI001421E01D|nr:MULTISPECIES: PLDc N-terminal domain-containing protein [unclassified Salinibacterium]